MSPDVGIVCLQTGESYFSRRSNCIPGRTDLKKSVSWREDYWARKAALEAVYSNGDAAGDSAAVRKDYTALQTGGNWISSNATIGFISVC